MGEVKNYTGDQLAGDRITHAFAQKCASTSWEGLSAASSR
jgi:hypothetical protein